MRGSLPAARKIAIDNKLFLPVSQKLNQERKAIEREKSKAELEKRVREEIAKLCRAREITNREKCADAGVTLP